MKKVFLKGTLIALTLGALLVSCNKEGCICKFRYSGATENDKFYVSREDMLGDYAVKTCSALTHEIREEWDEDFDIPVTCSGI